MIERETAMEREILHTARIKGEERTGIDMTEMKEAGGTIATVETRGIDVMIETRITSVHETERKIEETGEAIVTKIGAGGGKKAETVIGREITEKERGVIAPETEKTPEAITEG